MTPVNAADYKIQEGDWWIYHGCAPSGFCIDITNTVISTSGDGEVELKTTTQTQTSDLKGAGALSTAQYQSLLTQATETSDVTFTIGNYSRPAKQLVDAEDDVTLIIDTTSYLTLKKISENTLTITDICSRLGTLERESSIPSFNIIITILTSSVIGIVLVLMWRRKINRRFNKGNDF